MSGCLIDFYRSIKDCSINIFVAHDQLDAVISDLSSYKNDCHIYPFPKTEGVNESLKLALRMVPEGDEVVVNPVTTIPVSLPRINEVQIAEKSIRYRICSNIILKGGRVS